MTKNIHPVVQEKLLETSRGKAAEAQSAEAKVQDLGAINTSLKAELADQQQVAAEQQSKLQAASGLKAQLSQLEMQLEAQKKVTSAMEEQGEKMTAANKNQAQEVAALKARLAEVC